MSPHSCPPIRICHQLLDFFSSHLCLQRTWSGFPAAGYSIVFYPGTPQKPHSNIRWCQRWRDTAYGPNAMYETSSWKYFVPSSSYSSGLGAGARQVWWWKWFLASHSPEPAPNPYCHVLGGSWKCLLGTLFWPILTQISSPRAGHLLWGI